MKILIRARIEVELDAAKAMKNETEDPPQPTQYDYREDMAEFLAEYTER